MIVVGLMSGTSVDAIDAAVVRLEQDGPTLWLEPLVFVEYPHPAQVRQRILDLFPPHRGSVRAVCEANVLIGEAFAEAALVAIAQARLSPHEVDLIASHGQTVYHQVAPGHVRSTLQIGTSAVIAERTGLTTVADFRARDIAAGGQGAPLVSFVDVLIFGVPGQTVAVQNIGGIANATILGEQTFAFDTGPGNALIDHAAVRLSNGELRCDQDGRWAAQGKVQPALLVDLLAHPYFEQRPPKTTGREVFGAPLADAFIDRALALGLSRFDILATLTALTAQSIAQAYADFVPGGVDRVVLGGGGGRNPTLVKMLKQALRPQVSVAFSDDFGLSSDGKEAIAFAVLGYLALYGWPGTLAACTGARRPTVLGHLVPGDNYRECLHKVLEVMEPPERIKIKSAISRAGQRV
ncbi:MAG: anhydro-N-acetylmuramic acid kinase [Anaerolineae bacterium]|nr:anhydro-N-acetylmuramic acid kinase [Anaerolineae bacterium]